MGRSRGRVLAIGLDSAESSLVRYLVAQGHLPVLAGLLEAGSWSHVVPRYGLGTASVWPTFMTGLSPERHGIYNEWAWDPHRMSVRRPDLGRLEPFWRSLAARGATVGVLDVPFAPLIGLDNGFEVAEWAAHDRIVGSLGYGPSEIGRILDQHTDHPYARGRMLPVDSVNEHELGRIVADGIKGITSRGSLVRDLIRTTSPDLTLVVFPEIHEVGHYLWHTVSNSPSGEVFATEDGLRSLYARADEEIGRLIAEFDPNTSVVVFSLIGMQPAKGWPTFLGSILEAAGFLTQGSWKSRSARENAAAITGWVKSRVPRSIKRIYRESTGAALQSRVAQSTMVPSYDWARTRAFPVMEDYLGMVRMNVAGRERKGIVTPSSYRDTRELIVEQVRAARTADEESIVARVTEPEPSMRAVDLAVPDVAFEWSEAVWRTDRITVNGSDSTMSYRARTGRHAGGGFCIATGKVADSLKESVDVDQLGAILADCVGSD